LKKIDLAEIVEGGPIELGHLETIADYFRSRQDFFRRIDEAFVKIGADLFDCRAQVLRDRF